MRREGGSEGWAHDTVNFVEKGYGGMRYTPPNVETLNYETTNEYLKK